MKKVIRIGRGQDGDVFCKIEWTDDGRLSISGVEGPRANGNCKGYCGQIVDHIHVTNFAPGWDQATLDRFVAIWHEYHLNDMQPGCEHQRSTWNTDKEVELNWVRPEEHPDGILCKPCEVCGYKYGSAWLRKDVPQDVIDWLFTLPDADKTPAWV